MKTCLMSIFTILLVGCGSRVEVEEQRTVFIKTVDKTASEKTESRVVVAFAAGEHAPTQQFVQPMPKHPEPVLPRPYFDERLIGKWRIVQGDVDGTVEFTRGGNMLFVWFHPGLNRDWTQTGTFKWHDPSGITISESGSYGGESQHHVEFLPDGGLLISQGSGNAFRWLFGRLERVELKQESELSLSRFRHDQSE